MTSDAFQVACYWSFKSFKEICLLSPCRRPRNRKRTLTEVTHCGKSRKPKRKVGSCPFTRLRYITHSFICNLKRQILIFTAMITPKSRIDCIERYYFLSFPLFWTLRILMIKWLKLVEKQLLLTFRTPDNTLKILRVLKHVWVCVCVCE
jgi:hypothetical protein